MKTGNIKALALLLGAVTLAIYMPVKGHDFLDLDDDYYVTHNYAVQHGLTWQNCQWAFATFHAANWHPLTWISHMADCQFFGLNSGAHHLMNVFFHTANALLLLVVLGRMTGKPFPSFVVAALFAWHPLHVETVAWVAERKDVLSTFFALWSLMFYVQYVQIHGRRAYWLSLFFFLCSLLSKPMFVTFPGVLLLLDFWPLGRVSREGFHLAELRPLIIEKIPHLLLTAALCGITFWAQRTGGAVMALGDWPVSDRLENALFSLGCYLFKIVCPVNLALLYPLAPISITKLILAATGVAAVSVWFWKWRTNRYGMVGWLWFVGTLVPVIGLVQVGDAAMADRYTYFPSIGLFMAFVFGLEEWATQSLPRLKILMTAEWLVLAVCLGLTVHQLTYWRNTETLFRHTLAITPKNGPAHLVLGRNYDWDGRYDEALVEYQKVLRDSPRMPQMHLVIGDVLLKLGRTDEAMAEYRLELKTGPNPSMVHNSIGMALAKKGDLAAAALEFQEAIRLSSHYAEPYLGLAKIHFMGRQNNEAAYDLLGAFHAQPENFHTLAVIAHYMAANTDTNARDPQTALLMARAAAEWSANQQPEVFDVMGMAFAAMGDFTNAVICAQNALEFAPEGRVKDTAPFQHRLELYQNHQPWLESFAGTNGIPP
jgi:tetratricopeptide (TPR) repeat protein